MSVHLQKAAVSNTLEFELRFYLNGVLKATVGPGAATVLTLGCDSLGLGNLLPPTMFELHPPASHTVPPGSAVFFSRGDQMLILHYIQLHHNEVQIQFTRD
ncbi:MAG TPA: hypothetical protein VGC21_03590 [Telluria sp.]|jgi:hypothetical protein